MKASRLSFLVLLIGLSTAAAPRPQEPLTLATASLRLMGIPLAYAEHEDRLVLYSGAVSRPGQRDWMQFRPDGRELLPQTGMAIADPAGIESAVMDFKVTEFKPLAVDSTILLEFTAADGTKIRAGRDYQPVTNFHYNADSRHWAVAVVKGRYANKVSIIHDGREVKIVETPLAGKGTTSGGRIVEKNGALICSEFQWEWQASPTLRQMPIKEMSLSPDGNRLAYVVDTNKRNGCFVVLDGQEGPGLGNVLRGSLRFSPDGKHLVYASLKVWDGNMGSIVYDGETLTNTDIEANGASRWFFSPDGRYLVIPTLGFMDVLHAKVYDIERRQYVRGGEVIELLRFSPEGGRFMHMQEMKGGGQKVISGDTESKVFGKIESLRFSPDGARAAWIATTNNQKVAVLDGTGQTSYGDVERLVFSPDGKRSAYAARNAQKKWVLVVDGKEWGPYDKIEGSRDSDHDEYFPASPEFFSPDGKHVAATVRLDKKVALVVNGETGYSAAKLGAPVFSPNGLRTAVWASDGAKEFIVVDGKEMPKFDAVDKWQLVFSPDGQHIAYKAKVGKQWFLAVDDAVSANPFDTIVTAHQDRISFVFTAPDALYYVGLKDKKIYLVEEKIEPAGSPAP